MRKVQDHAMSRMARELDSMTRSVGSEEADLLESVLRKLKAGKAPTAPQSDGIRKMHSKYLSNREAFSDEDVDEDEEVDS